ncbi:hypothetical protein A2T76_17705 [Pseudomonas brenneri]|nr:hypothetical protein A2T76_17705 [Pseudomonas brenneri]
MALIECPVEHLVNYAGSNCDKYQISAHLLPFVAVVMGQPAEQATIQLLGNAWGKRLSPGQVFLYSRWKWRTWVPIVAVATEHTQYAASVNTGAMTPIASAGTFPLITLAALVALLPWLPWLPWLP